MNPRITDDDKGKITASLNGQELRGWSYDSDEDRRQKMLQAREYVEGWWQRSHRDIPPSGKVEPARSVLDILNPVAAAVENLACHQEQCDHDGVMVKVSRQALDEVLEAINKIAIGV